MTKSTMTYSKLPSKAGILVYLEDGCSILARDQNDGPPFRVDRFGRLYTRLSNYAIIPQEEHDRLLEIEHRMEGLEK